MINRPVPIDAKPLKSDSSQAGSLYDKESEAINGGSRQTTQ
jgi:hypothetical protein